MIGRWLRRLIANSLYWEVQNCSRCERDPAGFDSFVPCELHQHHISMHNVLLTFKED